MTLETIAALPQPADFTITLYGVVVEFSPGGYAAAYMGDLLAGQSGGEDETREYRVEVFCGRNTFLTTAVYRYWRYNDRITGNPIDKRELPAEFRPVHDAMCALVHLARVPEGPAKESALILLRQAMA